MPGNVEHVVNQAMITERYPNLQPDSHAHTVLSVEQKLDEARQVQIADFPHPPLEGILALVVGSLVKCLGVAVGLKSGEVQPLQHIAINWLPSVLALEIPLPWRPTANRRGAARADPADERRQSAVGSAAHPWRAAQARL